MASPECIDERVAHELVSGALPEAAAIGLARHLQECANCDSLVTKARATWKAADETPTVAAPELTIAGPLGAASAAAPLAAGALVGRYLLLGPLGEGGMGLVYAAYDPKLERKVAIKLLRPSLGGTPESNGQGRLLREAQAMARLAHPNVVGIHDVGTFGDAVFLAMELVEGGTVKEWLVEKPRSVEEIVRVFLAAGRGLAAAHDAGLIHRDFKPPNILLGKDGVVRVADFGIARAANGADEPASAETPTPTPTPTPTRPRSMLDTQLTQVGLMIGTLGYMPPEQVAAEPTTALSDQFSFCVSLFLALYGARPFPGKTVEELEAAFKRPPVEPESPRLKVPLRLRRLLARGLSMRPEDRFPSMHALLAELAVDPRVRRRRLSYAVLALAAVSGLALAGVWFKRGREQLCLESERRLEPVWGEARRQAIREAFLATKSPYAQAAWDGAAPLLDAYAKQLARASHDACVAGVWGSPQAQRSSRGQADCLDQRFGELSAFSDVLAQADDAVVQLATQTAAGLPLLSTCEDIAALEARAGAATDPAKRAELARLEAGLARAKAHRAAARFEEALALAREVQANAKRLGSRSLEAQAELLIGVVLDAQGDAANAEKSFAAAVLVGTTAREDRVVVQAAGRLAYVIGFGQDRYVEGERWGQFAVATAERIGADEALQADANADLGTAYYGAGRYDEALVYGQRALELRRHALGAESWAMAKSWNSQSNVLSGMGRIEEAREAQERAVAISEKLLGPGHPDSLMFRGNLASNLLLLGRYEEAEPMLRLVLTRYAAVFPSTHRKVGFVRLFLADTLREEKKLDEALVEAEAGLRIFSALNPAASNSGFAHGSVGRVHLAAGRYPAALAALEQSVAILEKLYGPSQADMVEFQASLGEALIALGRPAEALAVLERAVATPNPEKQVASEAARARFALARALWDSRGDKARARELAQQAKGFWQKAGFRKAEVAQADAWLAGH